MNGSNYGHGPAFPCLDTHCGEIYQSSTGMTLRDYFAAKAMQGEIPDDEQRISWYAKRAYKIADAMLAERDK